MTEGAKILIVDDIESNRDVLNDFLIMLEYSPLHAENGLSALAHMRKSPPDLVLLDIMMPIMDGFETLDNIMNDSNLRTIPVIVITAVDEMESVVKCIQKGADDYLVKPFNPTILKARIDASLVKKRLLDKEKKHRIQIEEYNLNLEGRVHQQVQLITSGQQAIIFALAKLAESRDPETGGHLERMCEYCRILSVELGAHPKYSSLIDAELIANLYAAAPLHDIGKVGVPDYILRKPGKLTHDEFEIMKTHTTTGAETLREVDVKHPGNKFVTMGIEIAESHQEKWNGEGYPTGLSGEHIPLSARILSLADVYDALTSKRVYKEAFSHERSFDIIVGDRGGHFDPDITDAFISTEKVFKQIHQRFTKS